MYTKLPLPFAVAVVTLKSVSAIPPLPALASTYALVAASVVAVGVPTFVIFEPLTLTSPEPLLALSTISLALVNVGVPLPVVVISSVEIFVAVSVLVPAFQTSPAPAPLTAEPVL